MDKSEYLRQLDRELSKIMDHKEIQSVLGDYAEYFDEGAREGATESELCKRFGPPKQVATEIAQSLNLGGFRRNRILNYFVFLFFGAMSLQLQYTFANNVFLSVIFALYLPVYFILWMKSRGPHIVKPRTERILRLLSAVPAVFFIIYWLTQDGLYVWQWFFGNYSGDLVKVGPSTSTNLQLIYSLALLGILNIFISAYQKGITNRISLAFIFSGFMQSVWCVWYSLRTLASTEQIINYLIISAVPAIVGIIAFIISALIISVKKRRAA